MASHLPAHKQVIDAMEDPRRQLLRRVLASRHFRASARLKEFLLYVTDCAIREAPEEATEQQIGIRVFRREPGFNSSEDSIVRSQARLLRLKLAAYFSEEGAAERIIIEIPKGHYLPVFRPANSQTEAVSASAVSTDSQDHPQEVTAPAAPESLPSEKKPSRRYPIFILAGLGWLVALVAVILLGVRLPHRHAATMGNEGFWRPFLAGDPPLVIYSNALFVGDSKNGLRYASDMTNRDASSKGPVVDNYTGTGEVVAVHELTQLFDDHHVDFILKRSLLVTWDEARWKNLIFIGSTAENPSLKVLPSTSDFTMVSNPDSAGFVNHHPLPGEPALFSRPEHPMTKDYAIIALLPGVEQGRHLLIFSGLTTLGTQAAVEFACRPESAALLQNAVTKGETVHPFEALLEVTLSGGVPLQSKLISVRVH